MIKLTVTDIKQYIYCPRIIYFTYVQPVPKKTTAKMNFGKEAHSELDRLEKRRRLKTYDLAEGERKFHTRLYSGRLGLEGILDMHIVSGRELYPVEFKDTYRGPMLNHKYQITAYAMLLEELYSLPVRKGFLYLKPLEKAIPIEITANMRLFAQEIIAKIRKLIEAEVWPRENREKKRCIDCEYRRYCADVG